MDGVYTDKSKGLASTSSGSHWYVFTKRTWHTTSMVAVHLNFSWKSHFVTPYCLKVGSVELGYNWCRNRSRIKR